MKNKCIVIHLYPYLSYSEIESYGQGIALVTTLKMLNKRLTKEWLLS